MKRLKLTLFAILLAAPSPAQEPITVRGKTASIIRLDSKATGEVGWILDERLESDERSYRDLAAKRLIVVPPQSGRYVCHAFSVESGKPTVQKYIVIAEGGPVPPGPTPEPPVETIATKLAAAFAEDKSAGAGTDADKISLGKLYRLLSDQTNHAAIAVVGDAHAARRAVVNSVFGAKLPKTVETADFYCREKLGGAPSTALTQAMRDALKAAMLEIAAALIGDAPPPPPPPPGPSPISEPGLHVLIVYETAEKAKLPPAQLSILTSLELRDYVKSKNGQLSIQDKDTKEFKPGNVFYKAMQRSRTSLPWLIIGNAPTGGFEGPLPGTTSEVLALIRKAGA